MLVAILLLLLVSYTLRETVSYSFPSHFFHLDGRYCFELTEDKPQGQRCNYFVDLRTKYPFIIASFNLGEDNKGYEDSVHVVKPTFWPEINLQQPEDVSIEFTIENVFHQSQLNLSSPFKRIYNCSNFNPFVLRSNGILRLSIPCPVQSQAAHFDLRRNETHSLNNIIRNHLCNINNILPGSWKIDVNFSNRDEDKWSACPNNHKNRYHLYRCPTPYYAAQYYPHSGCFILPLRLSLHLLYRYLERDIRSSSVPQKKAKFNCPFYTFIGDSLNGQIMEAGNCELENHHESLSMGKQYYHDSHSSNGNDININSLWNQYLRNDYPCQPQCLTNQTFAETDGKISPRSYLPPPCKGCSNRVQMTGKIHDHPEAFDYLRKIPQETRIVVIMAVHGSQNTSSFRMVQSYYERL